ncbi:scaffold protein [Microviridae sp.]|nr:scaffold protein [Microviridae sp.]
MAITKVKLRAEGQYDPDEVSQSTGLYCADKSRTQQSFKEECDINTIVRRFGLDGVLPTGVRMPTYGDFEGISDAHEAMNAVRLAAEAFMRMPAKVRSRFENDAAKFVDFCSDDRNADEAASLGLVRDDVVAARVASQAASGSAPGAPIAAAAGVSVPSGGAVKAGG